jgi:hypothetical protein
MTTLLTPPTSAAATAAVPLVLEPPRHLDLPPVLLTPGQFRLGASPDCHVQLTINGVAAEHATLLVGTHRTILRAIDPRTWLNDALVRETSIRVGDRIALGPAILRIRRATADDLLAGWPAPPNLSTAVVTGTLIPATTQPEIDAVSDPIAATTTESLATVENDDLSLFDADPTLIATAIGPAATHNVTVGWPDTAPTAMSHDAVASLTIDTVDVLAAKSPPAPPLVESLAELQRRQAELVVLRQQLADAREVFREETIRREAQLADDAVQLSQQSTELVVSLGELDDRERQLRQRAEALDQRDASLRIAEAALTTREQELADERVRLADVADATRAELQTEVARQSAEWSSWERQQQRLLAQVAEQSSALDGQRSAVAEQQRRLDASESEHRQLRRELEQERRELLAEQELLVADRAAVAAERQTWIAQRDREQDEHRTRERDLKQLEQEVQLRSEHVRRQQDQLALDIRERARSHAELQAIEQQLHRDRRLLSDQQVGWHQERDSAWQDIAERRKRLDAEADRMQAARHEIERLERALEAEIQAAAVERHRWQDELQAIGQRPSHSDAAEVPTPVVITPPLSSELPQSGDDVVESLAETVEAGESAVAAPESEFQAADGAATDDITVSDADEIDEGDSVTDDSEQVDIQAALDALAERFEEFSVVEHRLSLRHDELRSLQEDLAVREAELNAEREALGLEQASWEGERCLWDEEREAWEAQANEFESFQMAWEIARQAQQAELTADRRRWAAHLAELSQCTTPQVVQSDARDLTSAASIADPACSITPQEPPSADRNLVSDEAVCAQLPSPFAPTEIPLDVDLSTADSLSITLGENAFESPLPQANEAAPSQEPTWSGLNSVFVGEVARLPSFAWSLPPELPTVTEDLRPSPGLAGTETPAVDIEPPTDLPSSAAHELRSELAKMFDLPDDFAEHDPAPDEGVTNEAVTDVLNEQPGDAGASAEDWRSQLSAVLATSSRIGPPVETPIALSPVPEQTPSTVATKSEVSGDDSIAEYMERLLARSRQRTGDPAPEAPPPIPNDPYESDSPTSTVIEAIERTPEVADDPPAPRPKIDVEATRAELQSFRAVANRSARSALAVHTLKTTRTELAVQMTLLLASLCGAAFLLSWALRGGGFLWPGIGCAVVTVLLSYRVFVSGMRLRRWCADAAPAIAGQNSTNDDSQSDGSKVSSDESGFVTAESELMTDDNSARRSPSEMLVTADEAASVLAEFPQPSSSLPVQNGSLWDSVWDDSPTEDNPAQ